MKGRWSIVAAMATMMVVLPGCGGGGGKVGFLKSVGKGEGQLNLIAWIGYVEDGTTDKNFDWVHPFEKQTGCKVNVKYGDTSDAMVNLMRQGGGTAYDGVSASGDATNRLIAHGDVAPVNVGLISGWKQFLPTLQSPPHNTTNGTHYGVSYMYGANVLMYNKDKVTPAPTSWDVVFDPNSPYAGKVMVYGGAIYVADAALYLKTHRPELGIKDPYELNQPQLDAAIALLKQQKPLIKKYWTSATDEIQLFTSGDAVVGAAWPYQVSILQTQSPPVPVESTIPTEGATGWADTWMISSHAKHPNCMYKWMQWASTPQVQAKVAEFYGATPSSTGACSIIEKDIGAAAAAPYHCGDDSFVHDLYLWRTPLADCGNGRKNCIDYSVWEQKFTQVIGA